MANEANERNMLDNGIELVIDDSVDDVEEVQSDESVEEKPAAPEGYVSKEEAQRDFNIQYKKASLEEQAKKAATERADALEKELAELKASSVDLTIPPIPDPYDENYQDKIVARDEAIQRVTKHNSDVERVEQDQQVQKEQEQQDQQAALKVKIDGFDANMVKLGLNPLVVKQSADAVVNHGVTKEVEEIILLDELGPLVNQYLAENLPELDKLNNMSGFDWATKGETTINELRQKASLLKPQTSKAPDPPDILSGGGVPEGEHPSLKGVVFE